MSSTGVTSRRWPRRPPAFVVWLERSQADPFAIAKGSACERSNQTTNAGGPQAKEPEDIVVAGSGNLALVSFPRLPGRVSLEAIRVLYPDLIDGLARHPGVGFLMVRSDNSGAVVIGGAGMKHLSDGRVEGVDPLQPFGPHAAAALERVDAMAECGDL